MAGSATGMGAAPHHASAATQKHFLSATDLGVSARSRRDQSRRLQAAIETAQRRNSQLFLPAGTYLASNLRITRPLQLTGVRGATRLLYSGKGSLLQINEANDVSISGVTFDGADRPLKSPGLVSARKAMGLAIRECAIKRSRTNGLNIDECSGSISANEVSLARDGGIFSIDAKGLEIIQNQVHDIGDNGILVWQSKEREDASIVAFNRIENIAARSGGNGQNGNGIGIYRAGNVVVASNRISRCAFSAVRNNAGSGVQITGNNCSHLDETAIYVEFGFRGAVVTGNFIEKAGMGISITNFNEGGRMAVCSGNVVRDMLGARSNPNTDAIAIAVEADASVTGNVIDNAPYAGLWLGWGKYMRNIVATGNVVRGAGIGIGVSVVPGAGKALITNNQIAESKRGAILGMDHDRVVTGDLSGPGAKIPAHIIVATNLVS